MLMELETHEDVGVYLNVDWETLSVFITLAFKLGVASLLNWP